MDFKLNDNSNNMEITNTILEKNIRAQYNRNGSTYKGSETINNNKYYTIHPTQSSILHNDTSIKSDLEEKNNIETNDSSLFKKQQKKTMSIQNYSSKTFLQHSANKTTTINLTSHTTLNTSTIEKDNNTLIPHTIPVPITNQNPNNLRRHYINRSPIAIYQKNSININNSYTSSDVSNNIDPEWKESDTSSKNSYESTRNNNKLENNQKQNTQS